MTDTNILRAYTAMNLLEEACSRAGIPSEAITSEIVEKSLDQLNLTLTSLVNRGIQLWKRQQLILPCYQNVNTIPLPPGYNVVTTLNRRSMFRQIGTPFTNGGGTAALAFDDNFDTACTQVTVNQSVGCSFTSATVVTTVGILSGGPGQWGLFFEYSQDGVTYHALDSADVTFGAAQEWAWFDLEGSPVAGALFWRVRCVDGPVPLSVAEIFFGNTPQEIYLGQWNLDDYSNMPNKSQGGQVVNWYQQRNVTGPLLYVWPTPNQTAKYDTLVVWATKYMDNVLTITDPIDFPVRWYDAVTAMMARRLCRSLKEADLKRYPMLQGEEQEAVMLAQAEERDPAPTNYDTGVYNYTA